MSHGSYRVVYAYECSIMQFVTGWTNVACLRGRVSQLPESEPTHLRTIPTQQLLSEPQEIFYTF